MKKYLPITVAAFIWIWPAILIKILSFYFDNYTQNFYRYLAGSFNFISNLIRDYSFNWMLYTDESSKSLAGK
ncbi:hypothetical protein J7M02_07125 [Candidatus Aerophobetes bacterium]|nr:hypothetical protein [Candidatus Aerophobetes bacterium]